jgi:hypothetical protein
VGLRRSADFSRSWGLSTGQEVAKSGEMAALLHAESECEITP